jgi:exodeoxyribonuclease X
MAPMLRVIDMEGTGLEADAEIVELGTVDVCPQLHTIGRMGSELFGVSKMPPETRAIHHIALSDVAGLPRYDPRLVYEHAMRDGIVAFAAHNANYEGGHILGSLPLLCTYKAALRHWPDAPSHSVFALLYWLEDLGLVSYRRELALPSHRALPDAYATAVLLSQMLRDGVTGADLMQWTREPAMLPRCPIGDWRGYRWAEVEESFLFWIIRKIHDREDVIFGATRELDRRYPDGW